MQNVQTIETEVYSRMDFAIRHIAKSAGLGVIRGPYGIGKSHSVHHVSEELNSRGFRAQIITANPTINGHITAFLNALLVEYRIEQRNVHKALEEFEHTVMGTPFDFCGKPTVLIIDEAQAIKVPVLETLRWVWDKGDAARLNRNGRAFGMVFVANSRFIDKQGGVQAMKLTPLADRITMNLKLDPPTLEDIQAVALAFSPDDMEIAGILTNFGSSKGNVRAIAQAYGEARMHAGAAAITADHIKLAISQNGDL